MAQMRSRGSDESSGASPVPGAGAEVVRLFRDLAAAPTDAAAGELWIVDSTVGLGGHAELILEAIPGANVLGFDQDPEALELARAKLARFGPRARLRRGRLSQFARLVREEMAGPVQGVLFDLGVSSLQLDRA